MEPTDPRPLDSVLRRLLLIRLFTPVMILAMVVVSLMSIAGWRTLYTRQALVAQALADKTVDYLEHAGLVLQAVALVADESPIDESAAFMEATWEAYGYFESIQHLDADGTVVALSPPDPRYLGLDLSSQPYFDPERKVRQGAADSGIVLSQPFISLQTGQPTVYMTYPLSDGGLVVGALNLDDLQNSVVSASGQPATVALFIADGEGNLLAHPQRDLVAQQTNVGHLRVVQRGLQKIAISIYRSNGVWVLGCGYPAGRIGWVAVAEAPLLPTLGLFVGGIVLAFLLILLIAQALMRHLRSQLFRHIVMPLDRLNRGAKALSVGDFERGESLVAGPAEFSEVAALAEAFKSMSQGIQNQQSAIQEREETFRLLFELAPIGMAITSIEGTYMRVNRALCDTLGYSEEELLGRNFSEFSVQEDVQPNLLLRESILRGEIPYAQMEKRFLDKGGNAVYAILQFTLIRDAQGKPLHFLGQVVDISDRKRAEEEIRRYTGQLESVRAVGMELTSQMDQDILLQSIVEQAIDLLGASEGGLYLYRQDKDVLEWVVAGGSNMAPLGSTLRKGEGLSGRVWETGRSLTVDNYSQSPVRSPIYEGMDWAAVLGVPVRWGGQLLGVVNVVADAPRTFSAEDAGLLELLANQAAIAIRNAQLLKMEQQQRSLAQALADAASVVGGTLKLDEVLDRILEQVERVVSGDAFNIMLIEDDYARPVRWRGYGQFDLEERMAPIAFHFSDAKTLRSMTESGSPCVVSDTNRFPDWVPLPGFEWLRSYVSVPIQLGGETVGFLNVDGTRPGQFTMEDGRWLQTFANHAAIALQNARLYEQARRDAETRAILLHEVNHRVKNNLSAIIGMLYAEQRYLDEDDPNTYRTIVEHLPGRIQGLATVHSLLSASEWAPLNLTDLARKIVQASLQMLPRGQNVSVEVTPSHVLVTPNQAHNLALVINELTVNAVKHAWSEQETGHVTISIFQNDGWIVLEFRDDGKGYESDIIGKEKHDVGLYLVKNIVNRALHGAIELRNDSGAVAVIRFEAEENQPVHTSNRITERHGWLLDAQPRR